MNPTHPHPREEPKWREVPPTTVPAPDHGPQWPLGGGQAAGNLLGRDTLPSLSRDLSLPGSGRSPRLTRGAARARLPSSAAFPGRRPRLPRAPKNRSPPVPSCPRIQAGAHRTTQSLVLEGRSLGTESCPAKGYDFCCRHLAQDPCCGEPGPPGSSALAVANPTFLKLRGHLWCRHQGLGWAGTTGCGRLTATANDPSQGPQPGTPAGTRCGQQARVPPNTNIKVVLPTPGASERGRERRSFPWYGEASPRFERRRWCQITEAQPWPPAS